MRRKTILLTGATGFIGSHLVRALARRYRVVTIGRRAVEGLPHIGFDLAAGGRGKIEVPEGAILVHAGARMRRRASDDADGESFRKVNLEGTGRLLEALRGRPEYVLFVSTTDVYAGGGVIREGSAELPGTPYAVSKLDAERVVREYAEREGIPAGIARVGNVYGPGEYAFGKLIPSAIQAALAGEAIPVVGAGQARRDFLYVGDAVRALETMVGGQVTGVVNVVAGRVARVMHVVLRVNRLTGNAGGSAFVAPEAAETDRVFAKSRLTEYGWRPRVEMEDGLRREIRAAKAAKPWLGIDLDGTLLDHWERMYAPYREYVEGHGGRAVSLETYKKRKRAGKPDGVEDAGYLAWKRGRIESRALLGTDRVSEDSAAFLGALARRFRLALITARRRPGRLREQLEALGIRSKFERVIAVSAPYGAEEKAKWLVKLAPAWYVGDSEDDIRAAKMAGVRSAAVSWGVRSGRYLARYEPDYLMTESARRRPERALVYWLSLSGLAGGS